MKIFQDAFILGMNIGNCKYINKTEESLAELLQFMKHTKNSLKVVTGELDPKLYERAEVINTLECLLSKGKEVRIVFSKQNKRIAPEKMLRRENPFLMDLKDDYKRKLKLYYVPKRTNAHYAVVDDRHVFFEEPHEPYAKRDAFFEYNSPEFAKQLEKRFDKLTSLKTVVKL